MRFLPLIILFFASCATKKDVLILQDTDNSSEFILEFEDITIQPDDILRVKVFTKSPELSTLFSFSNSENLSNSNLQGYQINGYLVNSNGYVKIPLIKPIKVKDLTLVQASNLIQDLLSKEQDIINASVDVKIVNSSFTVLGEVNKPGRYNFLKNNIDLLQAIGIAGDLTINGRRDKIKILRNKNGKIKVDNINLTNSKLLKSQNFQIFPGDIIIVDPNEAKVKNAGIIGNAGNLLSVLSFILSSLILITNQ
tara:strand:- start:182 stop:937 length:756 start_codon:yes stop_codon:yes gene_type:complete